jgi:hypothetical protein
MAAVMGVIAFLALMFAGGAATALGFYTTAKWLQRGRRAAMKSDVRTWGKRIETLAASRISRPDH